MKKPTPKFKSEDEEREFWVSHDSAEFVDWSNAQAGSFPNLKPTTKLISIRLPEMMIDQLKIQANRSDIPYQSLIKKYVASGLKTEKCDSRKKT